MKKYDVNEIKKYLLLEFCYIRPLHNIVKNLEDNIYNDSDMDFLNSELKKYTEVAVKGVQIDLGKFNIPETGVGGNLNQENKKRFLKYFTILLDYFKSLNC